MYARVKLFIISLLTFEIPDLIQFQSPENRFLFSEPVRPVPYICCVCSQIKDCSCLVPLYTIVNQVYIDEVPSAQILNKILERILN